MAKMIISCFMKIWQRMCIFSLMVKFWKCLIFLLRLFHSKRSKSLLVAHWTPAISPAPQLFFHSPLCLQSKTELSLPIQSNSSKTKLLPDAPPNYHQAIGGLHMLAFPKNLWLYNALTELHLQDGDFLQELLVAEKWKVRN